MSNYSSELIRLIKNTDEFHLIENMKLADLLSKINASDIPPYLHQEIKEIIDLMFQTKNISQESAESIKLLYKSLI